MYSRRHKQFRANLDIQLKDIKVKKHQSVVDFCKHAQVEIEMIGFNFQFDVIKFLEIEKCIQKLDIDKIDWEILELQQIEDLVSYIQAYYDQQNRFDLDLVLQKFQTPFEIEPKEDASTITSIIENPDNVITEIENYQEVYKKQFNQSQYLINNSGFSNSVRKIEKLYLGDLIIFDCPGINDTDEQFRIINIYNIYQQILRVKNPIFLIVIGAQGQATFLQNFKETIKYFHSISENLFTQNKLKLIFILTKINVINYNGSQKSFIDSLYENKEQEIYGRNDYFEYQKHIGNFFESFADQRVLYFPQARQNNQFDLYSFKNQIHSEIKIALSAQQQVPFAFHLKISQTEEKLFKDLQGNLNQRVNITINFILQKVAKTVLLGNHEHLNYKLSKVEYLINQINQIQSMTPYSIISNLEQWIKVNYKVPTMDIMRFKNFELAQKIFKFDFSKKFELYQKKLKKIESQINEIQNTEEQKFYVKLFGIGLIAAGLQTQGKYGTITASAFLQYLDFSIQDQTSIVSKFMQPYSNQQLSEQLLERVENINQNGN